MITAAYPVLYVLVELDAEKLKSLLVGRQIYKKTISSDDKDILINLYCSSAEEDGLDG